MRPRDEIRCVDWSVRSTEAWAGVPRAEALDADWLIPSRAKFKGKLRGAVAGARREWDSSLSVNFIHRRRRNGTLNSCPSTSIRGKKDVVARRSSRLLQLSGK